ncbi:uncharacterized protein J3R85_004257 [Psidium guajava]|nr:uncharacterized protein J3R85_004257 [Psidium guajava]
MGESICPARKLPTKFSSLSSSQKKLFALSLLELFADAALAELELQRSELKMHARVGMGKTETIKKRRMDGESS